MHLVLSPKSVEKLRKKPRSYVKGTLRFENVEYSVAIRLKGHRSFRTIDDKPAIKLRFTRTDPDARFLGLKRLTINNMVDDPTRMRETLGYSMYRAAGVPAPNTAYTFLSLNGKDLGLYLALEPIDDVFVEDRFSKPIGGLYEGEYGCDMFPPDIEKFELEYGPETSRTSLASVAEAAAASDSTLFELESPHLDQRTVISFLAVAALLGDFDGYWHSHNYYIYQSAPAGKWMLFPWGIDRVFNDTIGVFDSRGRLAEICFASPTCRVDYSQRIVELATVMENLKLDDEMRAIFKLLRGAANKDPLDTTSLEERQKRKRRMREFIRNRPDEVRKAVNCIENGKEIDVDNDGYGCGDCNTRNSEIHPNATEICDGIDNDCNGLIDDSPDCKCKTMTSEDGVFHLCKLAVSWSDAKSFCESKGMSLAMFDNKTQSEKVHKAVTKIQNNRWWIGATDRAKEGTWLGLDGKALPWTNWASGHPDDDTCGEDCTSLGFKNDGKWVDYHCEQHLPFVCRE